MIKSEDSLDREQLIQLAKFQEQAERYIDMKETMNKVFLLGQELSETERTLFSTPYKNIAGELRRSFRTFNDIIKRERKTAGEALQYIKQEKEKVQSELSGICHELLEKLSPDYIKQQKNIETQVFFWKLRGDYNRYMCEYLTEELLEDVKKKSLEAYQEGEKLSRSLPYHHINQIRLGIILNLTVFYYEIMENPKLALQMAREAFDNAVTVLDAPTDYDKSAQVIEMLRDNITLWTEEIGADGKNK